VGELGAALLEHPTAETLAAPLMRALDRADRQFKAIEVYGRTRQRIRDELGTEPGSQLQALYLELLRRGPTTEAGHPPVRHLPTRVTDFTGRSAERCWLDDLVAQLDEADLLAADTTPTRCMNRVISSPP
jgi:DNA-binding SARP family transcriptional activator